MKTFLFSDHIYNQQMVLDKECFKKRSRRLLSIQVGHDTFLLFDLFLTIKIFCVYKSNNFTFITNTEVSHITK